MTILEITLTSYNEIERFEGELHVDASATVVDGLTIDDVRTLARTLMDVAGTGSNARRFAQDALDKLNRAVVHSDTVVLPRAMLLHEAREPDLIVSAAVEGLLARITDSALVPNVRRRVDWR